MASASSLRAELSPVAENTLMIGGASSVMAGAWGAVVLGPAGFALLAAMPAGIAAGVVARRRRLARREVLVARARGAGRGVAVVERASDASGTRGGQRARAVTAQVADANGASFSTDAVVYWSVAAPGAVGIAAWSDPSDVLLYFAGGADTPAELERLLNRETGQYSREPVLPDE